MITRGNGLIFAEEVVPDDTIQSLKVRVESAKGFPIPMQVFRHGDNVVEDHKTVRQMGWVHDAMVELTFVEWYIVQKYIIHPSGKSAIWFSRLPGFSLLMTPRSSLFWNSSRESSGGRCVLFVWLDDLGEDSLLK